MEPNKILSATLIDVIFDGRNKEYGAYELRKTNSKRTKASLSITIAVVALALAITTMGNTYKKKEVVYKIGPDMNLIDIRKVEKPPEKLPEPEVKPEEPVQTKKFTAPQIVPDDLFKEPLPAQDDLDSAAIGLITKAGKPDIFVVEPPTGPGGDTKGIIEPKVVKETEEIRTSVDVTAKFEGDWVKFLIKNLKPETPVNNNAPAGRYSVVVQFVVDKEGNVSDIKALTNHGYGVEEEAIRVLKKAPKWQPAIAGGFQVKAYHKQVIVFEVLED
jgi:periplasmic protein TonB